MWSKKRNLFPGFPGRASNPIRGQELPPGETPGKTRFAGKIFPAGGVPESRSVGERELAH
jgi:hypothetical protein